MVINLFPQVEYLLRALGLSLTVASVAPNVGAQPAKPPAPIRMDAQAGCPAKKPIGVLAKAKGNLAGGPGVALAALPRLASAHASNTAGEDPWLAQLTGKAGPNRLYQEAKQQVLVLTVCNPKDCLANRAYVAFDLASQTWGATVVEGGRLRDIVAGAGQTTLAMHPDSITSALICANNADMGEP